MIRSALTIAAATLGVAAPAATAHAHPHSYGHTFPVASSLCSRVAAGHTPRRLANDTAQITAACTTLSTSYQQAITTYDAALAPISGQVHTVIENVRAARRSARQTHDWTGYQATVQTAVTTLQGLRAQERAAQQAYVTAIRAARQAFWTTIHGLPGASALPADSGTPAAPTAPVVPASAF